MLRAPSESAGVSRGSLQGLKVVEFAGLGPVPFAGMVLADHGADVVRIDRPGATIDRCDPTERGKRSIVLDLKQQRGRLLAQKLLEAADVVLEGYRPGVMERLGLSAEVCLERNPRLIYGRLSGFGREGPLANAPGRDITYLALSGALAALGPRQLPPSPPLNLVGDYGGGAMFLLSGILMALYRRTQTQQGDIVDASILGGATALTAWVQGRIEAGTWNTQRESNLLDGGAPYYACYRCSDDRFIAVGAIDGRSRASLLELLGVPGDAPLRSDMEQPARWDAARAQLQHLIGQRSRDEWSAHFAGSEACVAPVLSFAESRTHAQLRANGAFACVEGQLQPAPVPRLHATPAPLPKAVAAAGADTASVLQALGLNDAEIRVLFAQQVVA